MATVSRDAFLLHLIRQAERSRRELNQKKTMLLELRTLEFWRAIIGECLATFLYVFLVCGAHVAWPLHAASTLTKSFASGLAMATAAQCFGHISGAHANPAFSFAMLVTQKMTPLRALLYIMAQCGGAIAGAALLYGVTVSGHREHLGCTMVADSLNHWQGLGLETILSFVVAFTMCSVADPNRKSLGSDALAVGISYLVCSLVALPATGASMNPARSLGPAFVMNTWKHHWIYWLGPVLGGLGAGLIYEYIFDSSKKILPPPKELEEKEVSDSKEEVECKSFPRRQYYRSLPSHSEGPSTYYKYSGHTGGSLPRHSYRNWGEYGPAGHYKF